jgi:DNA-binding transcriptional MerR regulator
VVVISTLSIGDFSRATHLGVKTLRHYHEIGLLEPVDVDAETRYRRYASEQIVTAQIIRRFRDLDMPLDDIHAMLDATVDGPIREYYLIGPAETRDESLWRTEVGWRVDLSQAYEGGGRTPLIHSRRNAR